VEVWAIVLWIEVPGEVAEQTLVPVPWLLPWTKVKRRKRRNMNRFSLAWVLNADLCWRHCCWYYHFAPYSVLHKMETCFVQTEDSMLGDTFAVAVGVAVAVADVAVAVVQC
jgi:hypothetical protein